MKTIAPDYYNDFACIAGDCTHSCCIGWEIDIDDSTFECYKALNDDFGKRILNNITVDGNSQYFTLSADERCPFLNKDNLCDIIIKLGEDKLCQICTDHPRYRNFFSDRTEIGLGLCCEAAAKLILTKKSVTEFIEIENDGNDSPINHEEREFFNFREQLFAIIQNRDKTIADRIGEMLDLCGITLVKRTPSEWAKVYLSLEQLDKNWTDRLNALKDIMDIPNIDETVMEQLLIYFLYRHLPDGLSDGRIKQRIAFAVHAVHIIGLLSGKSDIAETARMYSAEIEYSEENLDTLLEMM